MITDPTRINEVLLGLPDVNVLGVFDERDQPIEVVIELRAALVGCPSCGVVADLKDRRDVVLVDLPCFGRAARLRWRKRRFRCLEIECPVASFSEENPDVGSPRHLMTLRAMRWATYQVGRHGRSVSEVASDLGCDWHTINDAVLALGEQLAEDPGRFGDVASLGLDEHLFVREGQRKRRNFVTAIVDVKEGQLLDVVPGRKGDEPKAWLLERGEAWLANVTSGTLDLSSTYRSVFQAVIPHATLVADPFHLVRHANDQVDRARRRVQQEILHHRGRRDDPLYKSRRLLTMGYERLDDNGRARLDLLLKAGDPYGDVEATRVAKEATRQIYSVETFEEANVFIDELIDDMRDTNFPIEVRQLGRTLAKWRGEIIAWHQLHISNGPTRAVNNLAKRVKRVAFGFRRFASYRIRALLYAGKPRWELLDTLYPR